MKDSRLAVRVLIAAALVAVVGAIIAVIALSTGDSRSEDPPVPTPSETSTATQPVVASPTTVAPAEPTVSTVPPTSSAAVSATQSATTTTTAAAETVAPEPPPVMESIELPDPDDTAVLDPDASAKAALSSAAADPEAVGDYLVLDDVPVNVGEWTADDTLGAVMYTRAGGLLEETITVTSLGPDSSGLDHWRSVMTGQSALGSGLCGRVGIVDTCIIPTDAFGEVMLYAAEGVPADQLRVVAEGVSTELG